MDNDLIAKTIGQLRVGSPVIADQLKMVPLLNTISVPPLDYLTLDVALQHNLCTVTEVSTAGSVPELLFTNTSDKAIFLMDGEELIGAKQNRVLNLSMLIPANCNISIPVSCVEQGRWHHTSRSFSSSNRMQHSSGRSKRSASVSRSMLHGAYSSDQGEVWGDISDKFYRFQSGSPTSSLGDLYEEMEGNLLKSVQALVVQQQQIGAAMYAGNILLGIEFFDSQATMEALWPKLVRSYALDALDKGLLEQATEQSSVSLTEILAKLGTVPWQYFEATGEGQDARLGDANAVEDLVGGALLARQRVIHLHALRIL